MAKGTWLAWFGLALGTLCVLHGECLGQGRGREGRSSSDRTVAGPQSELSVIVGRPSQNSATLSVLSATAREAFVEFGADAQHLNQRSATKPLPAGVPVEFELEGLRPDAPCAYRLRTRPAGGGEFSPGEVATFHTQRAKGSTFSFGVQGDSHPERLGRMFDPALYTRAMQNVSGDRPDFYFLMGDDFSIERLIERNTLKQDAVNGVYALQRSFLGIVGASSALYLVNGNHEQAAKYLLNGTPDNFAVYAGKARTTYFPLPAPGGIYSGNREPVEHVGLLRDYYSWEWGDALFVVIDPYWHSEVAVDNEAGAKGPERPDEPANESRGPRNREGDAQRRGGGGGRGQRDLWKITLGDTQYQWLRSTLQQSTAKFKFVFSHHVLGTGRGGIEMATMYEWGGNDRRGVDRFFEMRPNWEQPIHDLMRDTGVTIFFQGHDHLYARQELDGVIYQSCPNPADPTFTAFNRQAYTSGDIFPNSGHLRVTVSGGAEASCKVEYVRAARPGDEAEHGKNGSIVHAYTVKPRATQSKQPATKKESKR